MIARPERCDLALLTPMDWFTWDAARFVANVLLTVVFGSWVATAFVRYWRRPRLAISYNANRSEVNRRPPDELRDQAAFETELHLFVRNVGEATALNCEGVLEKVVRQRERGWVEDPNIDLTPSFLEWAYAGGVRTINIPSGEFARGRRLSVVRALNEKAEPIHLSRVEREIPRIPQPDPFKMACHYRLHVAVHCENGDSSRCIVEIDHHGRTDVDIKEIQPGQPRPRLPLFQWGMNRS